MIPYGRQSISQGDIDAVTRVLNSPWLTQGPVVPQFETSVAAACGAEYAVACNSATSALHLACLALGVGPGDWVWTSPITFVASANCGLYCGAQVDFVDVDPASGNLCPLALADKLVEAAKTGTLPKVIIAVHLCGHSCDMQALAHLTRRYGISLIEDASHGIGGHYKQQAIGSCYYSDITVFSFHPVKIITAAENGMATTNNAALAKTMSQLRSHGITKLSDEMNRPDEGDWYYEQQALGFNYRMTELQGALGLSQLERLTEFVQQRNALAEVYHQRLSQLPLQWVDPLAGSVSARHLQMLRLDDPTLRRALFDRLRGQDIQVHVHYYPVYLQPYYQQLGFMPGHCPNSEDFYRRILTLPLFPDMTTSQQNWVCEALEAALI